MDEEDCTGCSNGFDDLFCRDWLLGVAATEQAIQ